MGDVPDFGGYVTKANLKCADGRTIMPEAFQHMDGKKVPLVWQHDHNDVGNVLGHAILESREDGVYGYGFFNDNASGKRAKALVEHGDIDSLSIFANRLVERSKQVFHGFIREVSLVLSGANPGAVIDYVNLAHSDDYTDIIDEDAIITMGLPLEHADLDQNDGDEGEDEEDLEHAAGDKTVKDVFDSMSEEQKNVVYFMIGAALEEQGSGNSAKQSGINDDEDSLNHQEGSNDMPRNVFEEYGNGSGQTGATLTHDQITTIVADAKKLGSFKESFLMHAQEYGITDIDLLFPDAKTIASTPELLSRRTEWVAGVMNKVKASPFSRVKSVVFDITAEEARARGYVTGTLKKEEVIKLLRRKTEPTTVYKKQKLDRDDVLDITDFDVVAFLKGEMRLMLEEELARAILIGDGRSEASDDKIDEDRIRPIAKDHELYAPRVPVEPSLSVTDKIDALIRARSKYKGSGAPVFYTTLGFLTDMLLAKDTLGRRLYASKAELASALMVSDIVDVEVMESEPEVVGIFVNLTDYTVGADQGGKTAFFDDFDIDYNQMKYLYESRVSGALTKPKSAIVITQELGDEVVAQSPSFDGETNTITIPTVTGVEYLIDGDVVAAGPVVITEDTTVEAQATTGYWLDGTKPNSWTFAYTE